MTNLEIIIESFQGLLAQACLFALLVIVCVCTVMKFFGLSCSSLSKLWRKSRMGLAAVAILSVAMGLWADKTNLLRRIIHPGMSPAATVSEGDILRGYRLEGVTTNETPFSEMPTNAVEYAPWRQRGGRETDFPLNLGDFVFPYGTNIINRFRVLSGGMIETYPALNGSASICAAREYASLVPGVSRFWSVDANGGAEKVLRWESVFANRNRTGEYSAEIRLSANGDFSTRSNALETVYRRVNPHDWDGDGLANEIDANPRMWDGDFFGTGVGWLNANCAGVLFAATNGLGEVEIYWRTNANPNAYYWLDLTATGALGVAKITAKCDGESYLGDLAVIARTNEVCHIPLLIGATYTVESDLPISHSAVSSEHANIFTNSEHGLIVSFPLEFSYEPMRAAASFRLVSLPVDVDAMLVSVLGGCCSCQTNDVGFTWSCSEGCLCGGGGYMLSSTATWQGYSALFTDWCSCPCPPVITPEGDQGDPSPKLVINSPRTLFTNADGSAEDSDIVKVTVGLWSPVETNGTVTFRLQPGNGVKFWSTSNRQERVSLPLRWDLSSMPYLNVYAEGAHEVARGGESIVLEWRDENEALLLSTNLDLAVYHPRANMVNSIVSVDDRLCNPSGIVTGTNACFFLDFREVVPPADEITWSIIEGNAWFVGGNTGDLVRVASDTSDQVVRLRAKIDDCRSRPIEMLACVTESLSVKLTVWIVGDGSYYARDAASVSNMIEDVNRLYTQAGVSFYIDSISFTNRQDWLDISDGDSCNLVKRRELVNLTQDSGGLELYFIDRISRTAAANHDSYGIVISTNGTWRSVAHEIGHAFGCADIYPYKRLQDETVLNLPSSHVCEERLPFDWNNGTGCRYYPTGIKQEYVIRQLLMYGRNNFEGKDIPFGSVYGFVRPTNEPGLVDVGFFRSGRRRSIILHR